MDFSNMINNGDGTHTDPYTGNIYDYLGNVVGDMYAGMRYADEYGTTSGGGPDMYATSAMDPLDELLYSNNAYGTSGFDPTQVAVQPQAQTPPPGAVAKSADGTSWLDTLGRIIAPVAPIINGLLTPTINNLQSGGLLNTATGMLTQSGNALNGVNNPNLMALIPQLQQMVQQGIMTPAQAQAAFQQASAMTNVQTDAGSLTGQREALARLAEIASRGGMTDADRAQLAATMSQTNANAAQQRGAQIQALQSQGNAGTGAELAARLSSVQGSANANAAAGATVATNAQTRALQALQENLRGNAALNTQRFQQEADKAKAQDVINQFNTTAQNIMTTNNAANVQNANAKNFDTANTIAGKNVDIANTQAMLPYNTAQKAYENALDTGKAQTGAQLAAGKVLGDMATGQITRTANAQAATAAGQVANQQAGGGVYNGTPGINGGSSGGGSNVLGSLGTIGQVANAIPGVIDAVGDVGGWISDAGSWIGDGLSAVGDWFSDENLKTDKTAMSDADVNELMGKMTGYKYRYKNDNKPQVGVMAQDMQKGGSNAVVDTPAGKMVQGQPALGEALAVLANQHQRLLKLEGKNNGR